MQVHDGEFAAAFERYLSHQRGSLEKDGAGFCLVWEGRHALVLERRNESMLQFEDRADWKSREDDEIVDIR